MTRDNSSTRFHYRSETPVVLRWQEYSVFCKIEYLCGRDALARYPICGKYRYFKYRNSCLDPRTLLAIKANFIWIQYIVIFWCELQRSKYQLPMLRKKFRFKGGIMNAKIKNWILLHGCLTCANRYSVRYIHTIN